jgi:hypothetical protein
MKWIVGLYCFGMLIRRKMDPVQLCAVMVYQRDDVHGVRFDGWRRPVGVLGRNSSRCGVAEEIEDLGADGHTPSDPDFVTLALPWVAPVSIAVKGILHEPVARVEMTSVTRDALLTAIAKARGWIDDLTSGKAASFGEIAEREGKVDRHIRFLAPLAFVSPDVMAAIAKGSLAFDLTVSALAKSLSISWADQAETVARGPITLPAQEVEGNHADGY